MPTKQLQDFVIKLEKLLQTGAIKKKTGARDMTASSKDLDDMADGESIEEPNGIEEQPEEPRKNLTLFIEDEILTVIVDLRLIESESRSGRSGVIASSEGNLKLLDSNGFRNEILNFSVTRRKPGAKPVRWHSYT